MMVARTICHVFALVVAASLGTITSVVLGEAECASAYNYLAGCLTFVSGPDTIPNSFCCGGVSRLNADDPHCLCTIIRQLDENSSVNYTKACALPLQCSVAVDVVECPILHFPPGYALPPFLPPNGYYASHLPGDESAASPPFTPCGVILLVAFCTSCLRRIL